MRTDRKKYETAVICESGIVYPQFPYYPPQKYPELDQDEFDPTNNLYPHVRKLLSNMGLDKNNFGRSTWNPLGAIIRPGQTVLVKPNWVTDYNPRDKNIDSLITHSSIIRTVLDYVLIALDCRGRVIIADAPLQSCRFENLINISRAGDLVRMYSERYRDVAFSIIDIRKTVMETAESNRIRRGTQKEQSGDPNGYTLVDLSNESLLTDLSDRYRRYRVTCYDHNLLISHHNREKNEYLISNSVLDSDAIINIAKMKCHEKAGITGAMKNLVGINGHKEYLPHHINGSFLEGGDQYIFPSRMKEIYNAVYDYYWSSHGKHNGIKNKLAGILIYLLPKFLKLLVRDYGLEGSWYGNETVPRSTIDLNHIAYFYDTTGRTLSPTGLKSSLHIVDGIVAGEGDGPLKPTARNVGVLIGGTNPAKVDYTMATMMGYNPMKIKTIFYSFYHARSLFRTNGISADIGEVLYHSRNTKTTDLPNLNFVKPRFWKQAE